MGRLSGKVAVITGASSGIGRAAAILFAREGANIIIGARRENELNKLAHEITKEDGRGCVQTLAGDVRSEDYARGLVDLALETYGLLDIAFNNAGILGNDKATSNLDLNDWNQVLETNLTRAC